MTSHPCPCLPACQEWAPRGIRVNTLSPAYCLTPMVTGHEAKFKAWADETPLGRCATPDDMVGPAVFLASGASAYCTGIDLLVDGGYTCW